jgi:hypothetical protein
VATARKRGVAIPVDDANNKVINVMDDANDACAADQPSDQAPPKKKGAKKSFKK